MLENTITSPQSESNPPPKWPVIPWAMLVGLILWLLFGTMSCAVKPTLITQTESTSRVVSANYGTFSTLDFEAPGTFLAAGTMSDGRISILYHDAVNQKLVSVIFDPTINTFTPRSSAEFKIPRVDYDLESIPYKIAHTLLINDSTAVILLNRSAKFSGSSEDENWRAGSIINLDGGEVIDIADQEQIGEIRVLLKLNDQKFAIAGIKGRSQKELLNTDPDFGKLPTGIIKTFDLTGKKIESKEITDNTAYALPETTPLNMYDRGDNILIFGNRLTIFDKTKLTFTPISNTIKAATVKHLSNGLLLAYPESLDLGTPTGADQSSGEIYLVNLENLQSVPIAIASALPIREQLLTGITEFTREKLTAALAPLKLQYRISILNDGTILLAANDLYNIGAYHWLIDLNGYKMLQPVNQIARTRLSTSLQDQRISFDSDVTLTDGRVLYLGTQNVLYTLASERTPEQETIDQAKTELPDWPGTDFKTQGVWSAAGHSTIVSENKTVPGVGGLQPLPTLLGIFTSGNSAEFFWGPRDVGDTISAIVESWQYGNSKTTNLLREPTKVGTGVKQTYPIHDKYKAMLAEQKQERYIVKTGGKTLRIQEREVERWDAKTKQWISIYQENLQRLTEKAKKQGKVLKVVDDWTNQLECANVPSSRIYLTKESCEAANAKQQAPSDTTVVIKREEVGGTLVEGFLSTSSNQSITVLPDGKILVIGTTINLNAKDSLDGLGCFFPIDGKGRYTRNCAATSSFNLSYIPAGSPPLLKLSGGISGTSNRGIEIYNPKTGKSEMIGQLTLGRSGHQVIALPDDKVAVIGGSTERIFVKDETASERAKTDSYSGDADALNPSYEIIDLKTGESKLYENVLMFRHDLNNFQAFVMPNGHIYLGDNGAYSGAEVLDWQNGISYPTGQPALKGLGWDYNTARLKNDELVSVGAEEDEIRSYNNTIVGQILDTSAIETYHPASTGRQLPIAQSAVKEAITNSYAWLWMIYLQLAQLALGLPLAYLLAVIKRKQQKFVVPL